MRLFGFAIRGIPNPSRSQAWLEISVGIMSERMLDYRAKVLSTWRNTITNETWLPAVIVQDEAEHVTDYAYHTYNRRHLAKSPN